MCDGGVPACAPPSSNHRTPPVVASPFAHRTLEPAPHRPLPCSFLACQGGPLEGEMRGRGLNYTLIPDVASSPSLRRSAAAAAAVGASRRQAHAVHTWGGTLPWAGHPFQPAYLGVASVQAPGTYRHRQAMHASCPISRDTNSRLAARHVLPCPPACLWPMQRAGGSFAVRCSGGQHRNAAPLGQGAGRGLGACLHAQSGVVSGCQGGSPPAT